VVKHVTKVTHRSGTTDSGTTGNGASADLSSDSGYGSISNILSEEKQLERPSKLNSIPVYCQSEGWRMLMQSGGIVDSYTSSVNTSYKKPSYVTQRIHLCDQSLY
jgi:hypothetical protein